MKLVLDTVSKPITGRLAKQVVCAVDRGKSIVTPQGKAFFASLMGELHPPVVARPRKK